MPADPPAAPDTDRPAPGTAPVGRGAEDGDAPVPLPAQRPLTDSGADHDVPAAGPVARGDAPAREPASAALPAGQRTLLPSPAGRPSRGRVAALAGTVLVLTAGVTALVLLSPDLPRSARVGGVEVGGMSRAEAVDAVRSAVAPRVEAPVRLVADGVPLTLDPRAAGLSVDVEGSVDAAGSVGLLGRLRAGLGAEHDVPLAVAAETGRLRPELTRAAERVDREPREGSVRYEGVEPVAVQPRDGRRLRLDEATRAVREQWPAAASVELPVERLASRTRAEDVQAVVRGPAARAVSGPVRLTAGDDAVEVPPRVIARTLRFVPGPDGRLVPRLDDDALLDRLDDDLDGLETTPRSARFEIRKGKPVVVPGRTGRKVVRASVPASVLPAATGTGSRTAALQTEVDEPRLTTERARGLGVREVIGTFTTRHPCCRPRVTNIHTMARIVDGTVVLPGETYSLNGAVGARDRARGFVPAPQILDGQFVDRVGGGVSQFATTMYNATFFAGLEDVEHRPHSYYITRYPEGREATVSTPAPDLKWRNDSDTGVLVTTSYTGTSVTVTLWGTKRYDRVRSVSSGRSGIKPFGTEYVTRSDCTASSGHVGFDITITRVMEKDGREVRRDSSSHRYLPEPRFICGPPPEAERASDSAGDQAGTDLATE